MPTCTSYARSAVVLAASAVQTPWLLWRSGLRQGPVGKHFQGHPGVSMAGHSRDEVRNWEGATQGHEVIGLRHEGLKFEALGFDLTILATRLNGVGKPFVTQLAKLGHHLEWGVAVKAEAEGQVHTLGDTALVRYQPTQRDLAKFRRGLRILGEMFLAAGADSVSPAFWAWPTTVRTVRELEALERDGPREPHAYRAAITHMFGTCRMGSKPEENVVRPDFRHHAFEGLYLVDSSWHFPRVRA